MAIWAVIFFYLFMGSYFFLFIFFTSFLLDLQGNVAIIKSL